MDKIFKCCRNKELKIYCCKVCLGIFHESCVARKKDATILKGHIIYCSKQCQCEDEDKEKQMDNDTEKLESLLNEKENKIEEVEEKLKKETELKESHIEEINRLKKENAENNNYIQDLKGKLFEFNKLKNEMLESIKTLSLDNEVYAQEIINLKSQLTKCNNDLNETEYDLQNADSENDPEERKENKGKTEAKKNKVLILCDEVGRGLGMKIKESLQCQVETIIKPGALFENVIEAIKKLTEGYTIRDYVIIIAGLNNFKNNMYPKISEIHKKVKFCTHTNILFSTIPQFGLRKKIKYFIKKFNSRFFEYVLKLNRFAEGKIKLIDILDSKGYLISMKKICEKIIKEIKFGKKIGNLLFIDATNNSNRLNVDVTDKSNRFNVDVSGNELNRDIVDDIVDLSESNPFLLSLMFSEVEEP